MLRHIDNEFEQYLNRVASQLMSAGHLPTEMENWDLVVLTFEGHLVPKEIPYSDSVFQGCLKVDLVKIGEGKEFLDIKNDEKNLV